MTKRISSLPPQVIAHRGASRAFTENTLDAFRGARALGADWVELDVRRTGDGAPAIHHDGTLPDGRRLVDIATVALPAWVPLLDAALDACDGMGVNIEIKNMPRDPDFDPLETLAGSVVALLTDRGDHDRVLVSSFHEPTIQRVRALDPRIPTALLTFDLPDPVTTVARVAAGGHQALHPFVGTVDAALVALAHRAGLAVNVWTCDDPDRMAELAAAGADGIVTNLPDVARAVVDGTA